MSKTWTSIGTNAPMPTDKRETIKKERKFKNAIRNVKSLTIEEMTEKQEKDAAAALIREENLLTALKEKKLKSKRLIKEATKIQYKREKKEKKNNKASE